MTKSGRIKMNLDSKTVNAPSTGSKDKPADKPAVKIYVSCHKKSFIPRHPLLIPVQAGSACSGERFNDMMHDDEGDDNISAKNMAYCELTTQYWAWKNDDADYYGFFHYRRYLSFVKKKGMRAYIVAKLPTLQCLKKLGYDEHNMLQLITGYDIIAPMAEEMNVSMYEYYKNAAFHHIEDLELAGQIIKDMWPEFVPSYKEYMDNTKMYPCNIFIMKKELFFDYCTWLFGILAEYDKRRGESGYTGQEARVNGYLAERLFGVYYTWLKKNKNIKSNELQRVDFQMDSAAYLKRKIKYFIVPPGSRRTSFARCLRRKITGR